MLNTILFDLDGTLAPFQQDEFVRVYFGLLVRRLVPMGYDGEKLVRALWKGVDAMIGNSGAVTNRQVFWECFTQEMGMQALALETILDDFYATDFDGARSCLTARTDRSGLIRSLRRRGYGVVLATNPIFPAVAIETRLGWVGLSQADFDYVTAYENSRRSKPSPGYYRDILSHLGRRGEECLMVGNDAEEDMVARELGMEVFLLTDCLINREGRDLSPYPRGGFGELMAYWTKIREGGR